MPHYLLIEEDSKPKGARVKALTMEKNSFLSGRYSLMFVMFVFLLAAAALYLITFNGAATKGYEITKLEYAREDLLNKREQKNISLSDSQTLEAIRVESIARGMRTPQAVEYYYPVHGVDVAFVTE